MAVISIGQKTIINVLDGSTIEAQYAKSTSPTTPPTAGWGPSIPPPEIGYYVWKQERMANPDGTFEPWQSPIRITGDQGQKGNTGEQGPQGLIGPQGGVGPVGQGIDSITEQYAISTNKVTPPAEGSTSWKNVAPTWSTGKYLWTRSKIVYKDPTDTKYTTAVCDNAWEAVNEIEIGGRNLLLNSDKLTASGTYAPGNSGRINEEGYLEITANPGNGNYVSSLGLNASGNNIENNLKDGDTFTFSVTMKSSGSTSIPDIYFKSGMGYFAMQGVMSSDFSTIYYTGTWRKENSVSFHVGFSNAIGTFIIKNWKLEKGNKATDWTPAPEDLEGVVDLSIKYSDVEYYLSTSETSLSGGSWQTTAPTWVDGKYMWSRTRVELNNGTVRYTPSENGTCIAGAKGATGAKGDQGIQGPQGTTGQTGAPGANAPYLQTQYSINGTTLWHTPFATGDLFMRTNNGTGWSTGMRIVGEDGANGADGQKGIDGSWYKFEFARNTSTSTPPSSGWRDDPYVISAGEYSWMRRGLVVPPATTPASWGTSTRITGDKGDQGIQGPAGTPGFLGLYAEGETLHLKGYGADGVLDQSVGYIYAGGERIAVPATSLTLTGEDTGYILFNNTWTNKVVFAKMTPQADTVDWIAYNDPSATAYSTTNTYVIGKFQKDNTGIHNEVIISPMGCKDYTTAHFMEIIATEDWASFQTWAEALNVTQTFERLAAYELFVNELYANNATIYGTLKTDNFAETGGIPTAGFLLDGPNSIVKMFEAVFGDQCTFYGKLLHSLLQTREAVIGNAITISAKTHWTRESFADFLTSKNLPSNSLVPCTGTYNGTAITHVIKATGTNIRLFSRVSWGTTTYTCPFTGNVFLYIIGYYYDGGTISLNGELQLSLSINNARTKTISVNKNDVIYAEMHHPPEVPQHTGCNYHADLVLPSTGLFVILSNGIIQKIDQEAYLQSSIPLSLTYGGTTWNSSSYLKVSGSAIMALLTAVSKGVTLGVTGTLIIDNTARSIVSMFVGASSVLFTWGDSKEILSSGYYNISGTFTPQSVTQAVLTDSLLPLVAADDLGNGKDIGTPVDRYRKGYFTTVDATNLRPSNISYSTASGNGGTVTMTTVPAIGGFIAAINNNSGVATKTTRHIKLPPTGQYLCNVILHTAQTYNSSRVLSGGATIGASSCEVVQVFGVRIE